jgi:hypothetical protein
MSSTPGNVLVPPSRWRTTRATGAAGRSGHTALYLVLVALFIPYTAAIYLGDLKLTPIKILIMALVIPALGQMISGASAQRRRLLATDGYMVALFLTMVAAPLAVSGTRDFVSAFSQGIEFYGIYVIARALVLSDSSIASLIRCLQIVTVVVVAAGALDIIFQRYVALDLAASLAASGRDLDASEPGLNRIVLGFASLRAASTFDHPILFGTFCAALIPIHLLTPMSGMRRFALVAVCVAGCLIALSSGPLLASFMAFSVCLFDALFRRYTWRWRMLLSALAIGITAFSLASENPMSWIFRNLTLDPQTAYFRLMIWDAGMDVVANNPWLGNGFNATGVRILDSSTDSLWLAKTIVYGIPMTTLLYLAPITAMMPSRHDAAIRSREPRFGVLCTAFSISLTVMMMVSITVTFWNAVWLLFAFCIGVRTSLKERCLRSRA